MAKITKLCASSLSLGTFLGQMNCLKVREENPTGRKQRIMCKYWVKKMNLHQRKKGKTHMPFFSPTHSVSFMLTGSGPLVEDGDIY